MYKIGLIFNEDIFHNTLSLCNVLQMKDSQRLVFTNVVAKWKKIHTTCQKKICNRIKHTIWYNVSVRLIEVIYKM